MVLVAVPPFPYSKKMKEDVYYGMNIYFKSKEKELMKHIHFEGVAARPHDPEEYYISDGRGYVLYATGMGSTVEEARKKTDEVLDNVVIPKMFYRNDIGIKFINEDYEKLKKWGYLS